MKTYKKYINENMKVSSAIIKILDTIKELRTNNKELVIHYGPSEYHTGKAIENAVSSNIITVGKQTSFKGSGVATVKLTKKGESLI